MLAETVFRNVENPVKLNHFLKTLLFILLLT